MHVASLPQGVLFVVLEVYRLEHIFQGKHSHACSLFAPGGIVCSTRSV